MSLRYSKKGSGLPITSSRIQVQAPCMKPHENPIGGGVYYPTERDFVNRGCTEAKMNGYYTDGRYKNLGMPATQYDVQSHSNVMSTLMRQPLSEDTYGW